MTLGQIMQKIRKEKGYTQKQLAEKCGMATGTIQQYELNKREPRREQLQKIATALEVPLYELMGFDGSIRVKITPESIEFDRLLQKHKANENLTEEECQWLINYFETNNYRDAFERLKEVGQNILDSLNYFRLQNAYETLNKDGQEKVIEHAEMIAKIPEYQKNPDEPPQE